MPVRYTRPNSVSALWSRRLAIFALALFAVSSLSHRFGSLGTPDFIAIFMLAGILAALAFLLSLIGFWRLWQVGAWGGKASSAGFIFSLIVLAPIAFAGWRFAELPVIHDVSTDVIAVPDWIEPPKAEQSWMPRSDGMAIEARERQIAAYPDVTGRRYSGAIDRVLLAVNKVVESMGLTVTAEDGVDRLQPGLVELSEKEAAEAGGTITIDDLDPDQVPVPMERPEEVLIEPLPPGPPEARIQAVQRSLIFGFPNDVLIRISEEEETTFVDMRVAARYGDHDLGASAAIIRDFFKRLDSELLGIAVD